MMDKITWIEMLVGAIDMFNNPKKEFSKYEYSTLIKFYNNYLEYASTFLYEDADFDAFIEEYAERFSIPKPVIEKLDSLRKQIDKFYEDCKNLDDFTLIRRKEWEVIIPLAKACSEKLNNIILQKKKL